MTHPGILKQFPNSLFFDSLSEVIVKDPAEWNHTHDWALVEERDQYKCWVDFGYGHIALTKGEKLLGWGKTVAVSPDGKALAVEPDYYGTTKYIWL